MAIHLRDDSFPLAPLLGVSAIPFSFEVVFGSCCCLEAKHIFQFLNPAAETWKQLHWEQLYFQWLPCGIKTLYIPYALGFKWLGSSGAI